MNIDTVKLTHILEADEFGGLGSFLSHAAFVVCHKSESVETLQSVLWHLPVDSPIIIVTNCPESRLGEIRTNLTEHLTRHTRTYLVHQKDASIAQSFREYGVHHILGPDGKVVDGKGEGMYIGTLCALLLGYPQWVIFFDADNLVPSALLEYTLAMGRMFLSAPTASYAYAGSETLVVGEQVLDASSYELHNVRICWATKPDMSSRNLHEKMTGRCTRVVSPLFSTLLEDRFDIGDYAVYSSNAGEQGMTIETARALRFSSGFSVESDAARSILTSRMIGWRGAEVRRVKRLTTHIAVKKGKHGKTGTA
jgi:Mannosyl-3-phosphoglycerate synthase (osmo_MPGsynth)